MMPLLVLRPEPGAAQTASAAEAIGLTAIVAPLSIIEAMPWRLPPGDFDALMLTSANAVRQAGPGLPAVRHIPVYAVGEATAVMARAAGLSVAYVGAGDAAALAGAMREFGLRRVLHLAGEVHRPVEDPGFEIERAIVYRSVPVDRLPGTIPRGRAVALIHSPAAGTLFASLVEGAGAARSALSIAAISPAAAAAAGAGWAAIGIAPAPTDAALLAIAAKLCEEAPNDADGRA